ncbi:glycosyltransferase [candidate division KSB1 bacterium]|nr:glycosyltransferase [candidate division KSB1 bacterium]
MAKHNFELSVILLTPDNYHTIRKTVRCLLKQTVRDKIELVFIATSEKELRIDENNLDKFGSWQVIEVGKMQSTGESRAEGIRKATAPIVVFAEDHSFPEPGWAEALISAHNNGETIVGPVLVNANPNTLTSWVDFFMNFGSYTDRKVKEKIGHVAWHSSSYPRDPLLKYENHLGELLEVEGILHADLREKGFDLIIDPAARTNHFNFSKISSFLSEQFVNGWLFAGARSQNWSWWKRAFYISFGIFIPVLKLKQVLFEMKRARRLNSLFPKVLPLLSLALFVNAFGEIKGYAFGPGSASAKKLNMEFHRQRFMIKTDAEMLLS